MQTYPWINVEFASEEGALNFLASLELDALEDNSLNYNLRGKLLQLQPTGTAEWAADFYQKCALLTINQHSKPTVH